MHGLEQSVSDSWRCNKQGQAGSMRVLKVGKSMEQNTAWHSTAYEEAGEAIASVQAWEV